MGRNTGENTGEDMKISQDMKTAQHQVRNQIQHLIEAALFVSTDPISVETLCDISGAEPGEVREIVDNLIIQYREKGSALEIRKIGEDHYVMQAMELFAVPLQDLVKPAVGQEVLKTLSLIALRQPVTQAEIVKARGYSTYAHIRELVSKDFIMAVPKGRTKMLTTTKKFADYFSFPSEITELKKEMARQLQAGYQEVSGD